MTLQESPSFSNDDFHLTTKILKNGCPPRATDYMPLAFYMSPFEHNMLFSVYEIHCNQQFADEIMLHLQTAKVQLYRTELYS